VAIGQDGAQRGVLDPFGGQDRAKTGAWIGMDGHAETHTLKPGADRVVQIGLDVGLMPRIL
jgi:hypothetical protein